MNQTDSSKQLIDNYADFWYFYLAEHAHPKNRILHYMGTFLTFVVLAAAIFLQNYWLLLAMPVCGYGFAWFGHFRVEHNRPATFTYPLWSLISDFRMFFLMLFIGLEPHLKIARDRYPKSFEAY